MKHRVGFNRLGRKSSHRKALLRNMSASLLTYERITTTKAKAKEVRRTVERMITRAKVDSVHNRREISKLIGDQGVVTKLFTDIAPRFESRPGGYTRILKIGHRQGDAAEMVILELVERVMPEKKEKAKPKAEKAEAAPKTEESPAEAVAESAPVEEPAVEEKAAEEAGAEDQATDESPVEPENDAAESTESDDDTAQTEPDSEEKGTE